MLVLYPASIVNTTLVIDPTSQVDYYSDLAHCESIGGKIYIPKTEADNNFMQNFFSEVNQLDSNVKYVSYPVVIKNDTLVWKDGQETRE